MEDTIKISPVQLAETLSELGLGGTISAETMFEHLKAKTAHGQAPEAEAEDEHDEHPTKGGPKKSS